MAKKVSPETYNKKQLDSGSFKYEYITTLINEWQLTRGLVVDGKAGPKTLGSIAENQPNVLVSKPGFLDWLASLISPSKSNNNSRPLLVDVIAAPGEQDAALEPETTTTASVSSVCGPFRGPVFVPKAARYVQGGVYDVYGRPPEEPLNDKNRAYKKAAISTHKGLPGRWNNGSGKLYCHDLMEPFLREALARCEALGVLDYLTQIGCYNYRPMRNKEGNDLSFHSWGIAVDLDYKRNRALYRRTGWKASDGKKLGKASAAIKYGPIPPPFSKGWMDLYPDGMPYELVRAFLSVGFTWGASWGRDTWIKWVEEHGVGWDDKKIKWPADWTEVTFVDTMHFELVYRR